MALWPSAVAHAQPAPNVAEVLPTLVSTEEEGPRSPFRLPTAADGALMKRARELNVLLRDAAQDLGLVVALASSEPVPAAEDEQLVARSQERDAWQVSPRLALDNDEFVLRVVVVPARSKVALVRVERVEAADLDVRAVVMLRDLVRAGQGQSCAPAAAEAPPTEAPSKERTRSPGRAILAVNAATFGGFIGYALQKSSGSDDARLTYPLLALGAGIGLGTALIVAEEWDVGVGDAWYLSAAAVWPTVGGLLLARGYDVEPESDRYAYGLAAGLGGLTLGSFALTFRGMGEGGAAVAHSGGALGLGLGAATELAIEGTTSHTPDKGMGYGAMAGVVIGGVLGTQLQVPASQVLMVDLGAGLGALSAAAVASPLLFGDPTEGRERAWVIATMGGAGVGAALAFWATRSSAEAALPKASRMLPYAGVVAHSHVPEGAVPAYGLGWAGTF